MGLKNQKNLFYTADNQPLDIIKMMTTRHEKRFRVDVDVNWLLFNIACGQRKDEVVKKVANFLLFFADAGFIITPICDGARHYSKRASIKRRADRERLRAGCFVARCEVIQLSGQILNPDADSDVTNLKTIRSDRDKK